MFYSWRKIEFNRMNLNFWLLSLIYLKSGRLFNITVSKAEDSAREAHNFFICHHLLTFMKFFLSHAMCLSNEGNEQSHDMKGDALLIVIVSMPVEKCAFCVHGNQFEVFFSLLFRFLSLKDKWLSQRQRKTFCDDRSFVWIIKLFMKSFERSLNENKFVEWSLETEAQQLISDLVLVRIIVAKREHLEITCCLGTRNGGQGLKYNYVVSESTQKKMRKDLRNCGKTFAKKSSNVPIKLIAYIHNLSRL